MKTTQQQTDEIMAYFEKSKREAHDQMFAFERTLNLTDHPESDEASSPAKLTLIKLIEQTNLSDDDLYFLSVIMTGFFAVPPAALFQRLRSEHEPATPDSPQCLPEGS